MKFTTTQKALLGINVLSIVGFGLYFLQNLNHEFVIYVSIVAVVVGLLFGTLHLSKFPIHVLVGITLWGIFHMMGGSVETQDGVLYAYRVFPFFDGGSDFYILKMDQVIHAFLYGVVGLMFYHLLREVVGIRTHGVFIALVAIFAAAGFSILNEIIEFLIAVTLPENGVGSYENTVLDLIFNLSGAALAVGMAEVIRVTRARKTDGGVGLREHTSPSV